MQTIVSRIAPFLAGCQLATLLQLACPRESAADEFTAQQILDRMAKTYAECKSYRDTGQVTTVFSQQNGDRTDRKPFSTAFIRPDRFRFEYKTIKAGGDEARHIIWRWQSAVQTWWDIRPGIENPQSLATAIGAANGVSSGAARRVPSLLMPQDLRGSFVAMDFGEPKRLEDARLENVDCYRVKGKPSVPNQAVKPAGIEKDALEAGYDAFKKAVQAKGVEDDVIQKYLEAFRRVLPADSSVSRGYRTLWIDKATFLIRRMDEQNTFTSFRTQQTTTYDPVVNVDVPDQLLEFNAPKPQR